MPSLRLPDRLPPPPLSVEAGGSPGISPTSPALAELLELLEEVDTTDAEWKYADLAYGLLMRSRGIAQSYVQRLELMHRRRNGNKIRYNMQLFSET